MVAALSPAARVKVFVSLRRFCTRCGYMRRERRNGSSVCECDDPRPVYESLSQGARLLTAVEEVERMQVNTEELFLAANAINATRVILHLPPSEEEILRLCRAVENFAAERDRKRGEGRS